MNTTTKKNLFGILLLVVAAALLVTGVFAIFSDRGDAETVATAGTVRIEVTNDTVPGNLLNINPGDHDWGLAEYLGYTDWAAADDSITGGSRHPIALSVENVGNKSVKIRNSIDLILEFAEEEFVLGEEFMFFLTETEDRKESDAAELAKKYFLFKDPGDADKTLATLYLGDGYYAVDAEDQAVGSRVSEDLTTCIGIRYIVFDDDPENGYILQGVGSNAEADTSDGIAADANEGYTYYLGLKAGADNRYQGATVRITWSVEAIQHRNTDSTNAWTKVASETMSGKVPAWNEDAEGAVIVVTPNP